MALQPCPECGESISSTVQQCPKCGFDFYYGKEVWAKKALWVIVPVLAFILFSVFQKLSG